MPPPPDPIVAMILPPNEGFGPGRSGAIGLIAHRLAHIAGFRTVIFGGRQDGAPYEDVTFRALDPVAWVPGTVNLKYTARLALPLLRLRPALVEVHNRVGIALALSALLRPTPVVLVLHNDPQGMRRARRPRERAALLRRVARVVTVSDYLRTRLLDGVALPDRPPVVLPNCLDLAILPPARRRERLILFVGRTVAEKGPDAFVTACAAALPHLPGWRAEIIGADRSRADSPDTPFVQMLQGSALGAGVELLGYRDHPAVLAAMTRAAIVVVPSRWPEPFGLVALEAMACGAALICSHRGGLPGVAGDAAIYVDPDNPATIAAAIRDLANDETHRLALAEAGRARAARFDLTAVGPQWGALRREIIRAGANP
ncbi:MAG: glycosyltransferase family 4 protein [Acetobacteraceae bacterium]|nr:glycosyltransferase family 4 protein [Acetobacteraceae bacterium]